MASNRPTPARQLQDVAGYRVIVRPRGQEAPLSYRSDMRLMALLEEHRVQLERRLWQAAQQALGPAFVAEIRDLRPSQSIVMTVAVQLLYGTAKTAGVATRKLEQFAVALEGAVADWLEEAGIDAEVQAMFDEASFVGSDQATATREPWEQVAPVLAAIGTGIGVLGFVTFVGGAVQFARFNGAGLPAEEALSILPTASLTVIGARALVPALLFAIVAVAVLAVGRTLLEASAAVLRGRKAPEDTEGAVPASVRPVTETTGARIRAGYMALFVFVFECLAFLFTLQARGFLFTLQARGWREIAVFVGLAFVTVLLTASIAYSTPRFVWLGATTFVAMAVFLGGLEYARASQTSDVRAAAIVRDNKKAVIGFYVAEASDRVYLGKLLFKPGSHDQEIVPSGSRLVAFKKDQISDIAVGPPAEPDRAVQQAVALAYELCSLQLPTKPPTVTAASKKEAPKAPATDCWRGTPPGVEAP